MALKDTVQSIRTHLGEAYDALSEKGVTLPEQKNLENLAGAIESVSGGDGSGDNDEYEDWGTIYYTNGEDTQHIIKLQLTYQADFNKLCKSGTGNYSVNNITLLRNRIVGFRFGNKCTTIGDYLLANCASLEWVTGTENIKTIGINFLGLCPKLNCDLNLKNVTSIGNSFLTGCEAFAKSITIPSGVTSIGTYFMRNCHAFTGELRVETVVHPSDANSLATVDKSAAMYTTGITLTGAGAAAWKEALPDSSTNNQYRKLIYVDTSGIEDLQHAIYAGTAETDFPIGTEIPDLWNGAYNPLIVAHYTDIPLADGTTQKGAYLVRKYVDPTAQQFGSTSGYANSSIKTYLDTDYLEKCSDEVKAALAETNVICALDTNVVNIPSKWFLMSGIEVGFNLIANQKEGMFWDYWKQRTGLTSPNLSANNGRIIRDRSGTAIATWLRSPGGAIEDAWFITTNGGNNTVSTNDVAYNFGTLPACAVVGKPTKLQLFKEALNNGTAATEFPIGTEIPDTWDGVDNPLIVAHYGDITLADDTVKNGCYLMRKYVTPNTVKFSSNTSSTYQYYNSDLYKYLAGDYLAGCTEEVKNTISQIKIETRNSNGGTLTNRAVKFFAMSYQEVSGSAGSRGEGVQWDLWKQRLGGQVGTNDDNAGLMMTTPAGIEVSWWLRTLYSTDTVYCVHGGADGAYINVYDKGYHEGVLPACFIAKD